MAVKTFNRNGHRSAAQYREIDIIRRLNHPNIVRLIAIEEVVSADLGCSRDGKHWSEIAQSASVNRSHCLRSCFLAA